MTSNRIRWVDFAKGISIILVVLHHSIIIESDSPLYNNTLDYFNSLLAYIRMPLFFFLAGLFVNNALKSDLKYFFKFKVIHLFYLYIIWNIILYITTEVPKNIVLNASSYLNIIDLVIDPPAVWFIYALLVFIIMTRLTRSASIVALGIALILFVLSIQSGDYDFIDKLVRFYPFYLLGHLTSKLAHKLSAYTKTYHILYLPVYFSVVILLKEYHLSGTAIGLFVLYAGGVIAGIIVGTLISRIPSFSWLAFIGKNTLPIYLIHTIPVGTLRVILPLMIPGQAVIATIIMLISGVTIPLITIYITKKLHMNWLFELPFKRKNQFDNTGKA